MDNQEKPQSVGKIKANYIPNKVLTLLHPLLIKFHCDFVNCFRGSCFYKVSLNQLFEIYTGSHNVSYFPIFT